MKKYSYLVDVKRCVYRYVLNNANKTTIYIGKTDSSLVQRLNDHADDSRFQKYDGQFHIEFCRINHPQYDSREFERCLIDMYRPIINRQDKDLNTPHFITVKPLSWNNWDDYVQEEKMNLVKRKKKILTMANTKKQDDWKNYKRTFGDSLTWQQMIASAMHSLDTIYTFKGFNEKYNEWKSLDLLALNVPDDGLLPENIVWRNSEYKHEYGLNPSVFFWDKDGWYLISSVYSGAKLSKDNEYVTNFFNLHFDGGCNFLFILRLNQNYLYQSIKKAGKKKKIYSECADQTLKKMHMYNLVPLAQSKYITELNTFGKRR